MLAIGEGMQRLLEREPHGLQRANGSRTAECEQRANGLLCRPERAVPAGAPRRRVQCDGGVREHVRGVRTGGILMQ